MMDIVGIDFESFYGDEYTLSKLTTEAYVRDPRWETIMVSIKRNDERAFWVPRDDVQRALKDQKLSQCAVYAHHCVPPDTEVLTRSGWKAIADVPLGVEIMQWRTDGALSWAFPSHRIEREGETLLHWDSNFHHGAYTPQHRMVIGTPERCWFVEHANDVARRRQSGVYIPVAGHFRDGNSTLTPHEARLMEAIRADGAWPNNPPCGARFNLRKERKIARLRFLCNQLDVGIRSDGKGSYSLAQCPVVQRIAAYLGHTKQYGMWVLDLSHEARWAILDEARYWDGYTKPNSSGYTWATADTETAAAFETMAHCTGWRVTGEWRNNARGYSAHLPSAKLYTATVRETDRAKLMVAPSKVEYGGKVYCFTVPSGMFLMRRNGRINVTGNCHFDGLVLAHHYRMRPKLWIDTLGMARALYGANGRLSLEKLCEREQIGSKGNEVHNVKGMHFADFTPEGLARYGRYSVNDIEKTYLLVQKYLPQFGKGEIRIHDRIIRMFTEPVFGLDNALLTKYRDWLAQEKTHLLLRAGAQKADLMSNEKFAQLLIDNGIHPPMKISKTTGKLTYAFAKTDPGIQALQEHPDEDIQILVEARLKNKTTIAEKGAERLMAMACRGAATVYLKYAGASGTHRLSGGDKFNWQSMKRGSDLRNSVEAPPGYKCVVVDSSTIEARLLDWISGQDDMVEVYRKQDNKTGPDMYCYIGGFIYERVITKEKDPEERQLSKKVKLGLGFGMGESQFAMSVRREAKGKDGKPLILDPAFCKRVVQDVYRKRHPQVKKLWARGEEVLGCIARGEIGVALDFRGIVKTCRDGLIMPNGLRILYPELKFEPQMEGDPENPGQLRAAKTPWGKVRGDWSFWNGKAREKIYGPKVIENIIQCLARIIVFTQCENATEQIEKEGLFIKWGHSVHDEGVFVAHAFYAPYVLDVCMKWFRTPLDWCQSLPLNCEGGIHQRYGLAKS